MLSQDQEPDHFGYNKYNSISYLLYEGNRLITNQRVESINREFRKTPIVLYLRTDYEKYGKSS